MQEREYSMLISMAIGKVRLIHPIIIRIIFQSIVLDNQDSYFNYTPVIYVNYSQSEKSEIKVIISTIYHISPQSFK